MKRSGFVSFFLRLEKLTSLDLGPEKLNLNFLLQLETFFR
jgi:hypothetical protein